MKDVRRGYLPEYEDYFKKDIEKLKLAAQDVKYLLNRKYRIKAASTFVQNHYMLTEAQRLVLTRCVASDIDIENRKLKEVSNIEGKEIYIDGFNAIIPMESLLSGSPIFIAMDNAVRDLANLKGSYSIITKTEPAIKLILDKLNEMKVKKVNIHLDKPISNSGRLKVLIAQVYEKYNYNFELNIELFIACDASLYGKEYVVSGDCVVMDKSKHIVPLYRLILEDYKKNNSSSWIVDTRLW